MRHARTAAASCAIATGLAIAAACGDPLGLPDPAFANVVDTVTLYALHGTPVATPSGYRIEFRQAVRVDQTTVFDFVFDIDTAGRVVLLPTGAVGLGRGSGIQRTSLAFDAVRIAPTAGYELDSAVAVDSGTVAVLHSRADNCDFATTAAYHFYAKLEVLAVDAVARTLRFQILVDGNCGYRGLEPGRPRS